MENNPVPPEQSNNIKPESLHLKTWSKYVIGQTNTMSKFGSWFSRYAVKRNAFKFGLEIVVILFVFFSIGVNAFAEQGVFRPSANELLHFVTKHPELNEQLTAILKTENIRVHADRDYFVLSAQAATFASAASGVASAAQANISGDTAESDVSPLLTGNDGALHKPNYATTDAVSRKEISEYTVKGGDSISQIAAEYGVSVSTILLENGLSEYDYIKPGQTLKILPTTGIKHTIREGETLDQIAKKYEVDLEIVLEYNAIEIPDDIHAGEVLIIPDGKIQLPESSRTRIASSKLVDFESASVPVDFAGGGDFIWPLETHNVTQYYWSRHRALDISNGQRPQFWSAESGVVELSGWQGDYGRTAVVNHGNGFKTRYAHASELYVTAGQEVAKGEIIGRVGNTGRVYGKTGNHIHFELMKNGVKINPIPYLQ